MKLFAFLVGLVSFASPVRANVYTLSCEDTVNRGVFHLAFDTENKWVHIFGGGLGDSTIQDGVNGAACAPQSCEFGAMLGLGKVGHHAVSIDSDSNVVYFTNRFVGDATVYNTLDLNNGMLDFHISGANPVVCGSSAPSRPSASK